MARFTVDCGATHQEVDSHEEAWLLALKLREATGEPVEINDTRYTKKAEWDAAAAKAQNKQAEASRVAKKGTK